MSRNPEKSPALWFAEMRAYLKKVEREQEKLRIQARISAKFHRLKRECTSGYRHV